MQTQTVPVDVSKFILDPRFGTLNYTIDISTTYGDLRQYLAQYHNGNPLCVGIRIHFQGYVVNSSPQDFIKIWPSTQSPIFSHLSCYACEPPFRGGKKSRKTKKSKRRKRIKTRKRKRRKKKPKKKPKKKSRKTAKKADRLEEFLKNFRKYDGDISKLKKIYKK
jgi:hypothetical protein